MRIEGSQIWRWRVSQVGRWVAERAISKLEPGGNEWKGKAQMIRRTSFAGVWGGGAYIYERAKVPWFGNMEEIMGIDMILYWIRCSTLSQWRDVSTGVMWKCLGVRVTARACPLWMCWRRLIWVTVDHSKQSYSNRGVNGWGRWLLWLW